MTTDELLEEPEFLKEVHKIREELAALTQNCFMATGIFGGEFPQKYVRY